MWATRGCSRSRCSPAACADSPLARPDTLDLAQQVDALEQAIDGPDWPDAVGALAAELRAARGRSRSRSRTRWRTRLPSRWRLGRRAARAQAEAGLAALRLLQQVRPVATVRDAGAGTAGRVVGPDPETAMQHAFVVLFLWGAARADEKVVYGPRFVVYTPVIQLADGSPGLDAAAAVREDANAIDHLCRLALATYDVWRTTAAGEPLRLLVDGVERSVPADGAFDVDGRTVLAGQGSLRTRIAAGKHLPFSDVRLAHA